jgi:hypothetical protein
LEPLTKFVPVTVSEKKVAPATAELGLSDVMVGALTVNVRATEEAVLELCTVTFCCPAEASWAVVTVAASEVVLPGVDGLVVSAVAPQYTVAPPTKFIPVTVSVKPTSPAAAEAGDNVVMVGPVTVNAVADEEAALELRTVTFCDPAERSWALVTLAVSEVAPTKLVTSWVPLHHTLEPLTKFVPVTVSWKPGPPATAGLGLSDAIVGPLTVNVRTEEEAPPGFCTVKLSMPALETRLAGIVAAMDVAVPLVTANAVVPEYTSEPLA